MKVSMDEFNDIYGNYCRNLAELENKQLFGNEEQITNL